MKTAIENVTQTSQSQVNPLVRTVKAMLTEYECVKANKGIDAIRQGDIYITKIDKLPSGLKKSKTNQLVPGSTQGSRHTVKIQQGIVVYEREGDALTGPVIEAPSGCYIEHPEHGDIHIKCGGVFSITYQRAHAKELKRVLD